MTTRTTKTACVCALFAVAACSQPPRPYGIDSKDVGAPKPGEIQPAPQTRAARLTLFEWENSVRDLLRLDAATGFSSELPADAIPAGFIFDNPAGSLSVDQVQWAGFQRAASRAAAVATQDANALARILPPDTGDEAARARAFIAAFGARAQRRPLTDAEVDRYLVVYEAGRVGFDSVAPFVGGVRLLIETFLQSPLFLYRVERSTNAVAGVIPLDAYEVAARLSYALYSSMPDDALFDAAAAGVLTTPAEVAVQARRMLDDPRATDMMDHVMAQLWQADKLINVHPAASKFPNAPENLGALAREESRQFLAAQFENNASLFDLMTSTDTFVNADLAAIYGLTGDFGAAFEPVQLDPSTRSGLLTHIAFLAQNATTRDADPIHRGVFVGKRLLCAPIAAPPANIPPLPADDGTHTNRERVELHTQAVGSSCEGCHTTSINPLGFPFEMYDATGAVQTVDNGKAIDTATSATIGAETVAVQDALDLTDKLVNNDTLHSCFAQHWLEATLGRPGAAQDAGLVTALTADSYDGAGLKDLLATLVSSVAFTARSTTEIGVSP